MSEVKIVLNREGVRELLRSAEMMECCRGYAEQMGARLGSGYVVSTYTGTNRVNASVRAVSDAAKQDNLDNNTMLKAVSGND